MEHPIDESLLWRYFEREVSEEEKNAVESWINSSEKNRLQAKRVARIYFAGGLLCTAKEVNSEEKLNILWGKLAHRRTMFIWKRVLRIAAILLLPVLSLSAYFILSDQYRVDIPEQMVEVRTQVGITNSIVLPDSSIVFLNSESYLKYPAHFVQNRNVYLKGEAYFIVKKHQGSRFIVNTPAGAKVEVLGTEFNVNSAQQTVNTTLVKGSVQFVFNDKKNEEIDIRIVPGQKITFNAHSKDFDLKEVDVNVEIGWRDGKTVFKDCPLMETLDILSKRFNAEFIVKRESLKKDCFTGNFKNQSLEQILENFSISGNMKYRYVIKRESGDTTSKKEIIELY